MIRWATHISMAVGYAHSSTPSARFVDHHFRLAVGYALSINIIIIIRRPRRVWKAFIIRHADLLRGC